MLTRVLSWSKMCKILINVNYGRSPISSDPNVWCLSWFYLWNWVAAPRQKPRHKTKFIKDSNFRASSKVADYRVMTSKPVEVGQKVFGFDFYSTNVGSSVIKTGRSEGSLLPYIKWFNMQVFLYTKQFPIFGNLYMGNIV